MNVERVKSKSDEDTLIADGRYVYSKYYPLKDTYKFMQNEVDLEAKGYVLLGLGLGYHLQALVEIADVDKPIYVMYLDSKELTLYDDSLKKRIKQRNKQVRICDNYIDIVIEDGFQVIIPNSWLQLMSHEHPLYWYIADLKMKQVSYKRFKEQMELNWKENIQLQEFNLLQLASSERVNKPIACLISSGPSLSHYKKWLKERQDIFILCVGSALASLQEADIVPDAVIITDAQNNIIKQFEQTNYTGIFFYLSTASHDAILMNANSQRCILLQNGYPVNINIAKQYQYPLLETGGSVATVAFSLLQYLGFEKIVLFGQDLSIQDKQTHDTNATSGREINQLDQLIEVESNNGEIVHTLPNLYSYLRWFEKRVPEYLGTVYNTGINGAYIKGTSLLNNLEEFKAL